MTATNQDLRAAIGPAMTANGVSQLLDSHGQPVAGIYADVENEDYHAIPALLLQAEKVPASRLRLLPRMCLSSKRARRPLTVQRLYQAPSPTGWCWNRALCDDPFWYHLTPLISTPVSASQLKEERGAPGIKPIHREANYIDQLLAHDPPMPTKFFDNAGPTICWPLPRQFKQPWATASKPHLPEALLSSRTIIRPLQEAQHLPVSDDLDGWRHNCWR